MTLRRAAGLTAINSKSSGGLCKSAGTVKIVCIQRQELPRLGNRQDAVFELNIHAYGRAFSTRDRNFDAQARVLSSIPTLSSMQNRAPQTRAQPTPLWTCTRAVCGVSSKQNPLSHQTPYDPESKYLCPIQTHAVSCPSLPASRPQRLG